MDRILPRWTEPGPPRVPPRAPDMRREDRFVQLFRTAERPVRAYILSLVPNWSDTDDLVQETLAVIWRKFDEFEEGTSFVAWALGVARFEVLGHRRRQRGRPVQLSDEAFDLVARQAAAVAETADTRRDALDGCLAKLAPRERELLRLRYEAGTTTRDVAERVGRAPKAVYKSLNRLHGQLLECVRRVLAREGHR